MQAKTTSAARRTVDPAPARGAKIPFQIEIGNLRLTKVYGGYQGFPRFLQDFKTGQRTFRPNDFPDQASSLKRMGIKYITPRYQFSGHQKVLKALRTSPGRVPQEITSCWGE